MAIAFDSQYTIFRNNDGGNYSDTVTNTAGNFMIANFWIGFGTGVPTITGVTYGGVAMTQLYTTTSSNQVFGVYYLASPATGANTFAITHTGGGSAYHFGGLTTYSGVDTTTPLDVTPGGGTFSGTTASQSVTTSVDNAWAIMCIGDTTTGTTPTAGSGTTVRVPGTSGYWSGVLDSNGPITPSGTTKTLNANFASSTAGNMWVFSIAPPGAAPTSSIKSRNGVLIANIKSADGILYANIKSADGVTN